MLDKKLLDILACPMGKSELKVIDDSFLECKCGLRFKIEDNIPIMLMDEAIIPEGIELKNLPCKK
jgi:uncharacterized protein